MNLQTAPRWLLGALLLCGTLFALAADDLGTARQLVERRQFAGAIPIYERLAKVQPDNSDLLIELARVYGFADRNKDAADTYQRVIQRFPTRRGDVLPSLAQQLLWSGAPAAAVPYYREALAAKPGDRELRVGLANALRESGQDELALGVYDEMLRADPKDLAAMKGRAWLLLAGNRFTEAEAAFRSVLAIKPNETEAKIGVARSLNFSGRHQVAIGLYRDLAKELPDDKGIKQQLATAQHWAGFDAEALASLEGITEPSAEALRSKLKRILNTSVSGGIEHSQDKDDLKIDKIKLAGKKRLGETSALGVSYTHTRLDGKRKARELSLNGVLSAPGYSVAVNGTPIQAAGANGRSATYTPVGSSTPIAAQASDTVAAGPEIAPAGASGVRLNGATPSAARITVQNVLNLDLADGRSVHLPLTPQNLANGDRTGDWLENGKINGNELAFTYVDRFGSIERGIGALYPRLTLGLRDYGGWRSTLVRGGLKWLPMDLWRFDFEAGNDIVETLDAIDNRVRINYASASADYQITPRLGAGGSVFHGRFNDGNRRNRLTGRVEYLTWYQPRVTLGFEALAFRDSDEAKRSVPLALDGFSINGANTITYSGTLSLQEAGRGYYNPRRYFEGKVFGTLGLERERWNLWTKLAIGQVRESAWSGNNTNGLYTFAEVNYRYYITSLTELHAYLGRSASRVNSSDGGGYYRAYGGVYLTHWFD